MGKGTTIFEFILLNSQGGSISAHFLEFSQPASNVLDLAMLREELGNGGGDTSYTMGILCLLQPSRLTN